MRTKIFAMSMGLAASVWLTGCQSSRPVQTVTVNRTETPATAKACRTGCDSLCTDLGKTSGGDPAVGKQTQIVNGSKSATTPSISGTGKSVIAPASGKTVADACTSCPASTGAVVVREPVIKNSIASPPPAPKTVVVAPPCPPQPAFVLPAAKAVAQAPSAEAPVVVAPAVSETIAKLPDAKLPTSPSAYGPGVEVLTAAPLPEAVPIPTAEKVTSSTPVQNVRLGQSNNYQTVVGQVYQFRRAWKLRYTAVESEDRYGGSLTLVGEGLDNLRDGQIVRVEGAVLPTDDRTGSVRYQVNRVDVIEPDLK